MEIKTIYVANDGQTFATEEACLEYEKVSTPDGKVLLFDKDYKLIKDTDPVSAFEKSYAIYIVDAEKAEKFLYWVYENAGCIIPENVKDKQIYFYNEDAREYMDLRESVFKLEKILSDILLQVFEAGVEYKEELNGD